MDYDEETLQSLVHITISSDTFSFRDKYIYETMFIPERLEFSFRYLGDKPAMVLIHILGPPSPLTPSFWD